MLLFANATLTNNRLATSGSGKGTMQPVWTGVKARVEPAHYDLQLWHSGRAVSVDYIVTLAWDAANPLDVRLNDELTGYNPRNVTPAPKLRVLKVNLNDAWPPHHLELFAVDPRTQE